MHQDAVGKPAPRLLACATIAAGIWLAPLLSSMAAEYQRPVRPTYRCPPGYYDEPVSPYAPRIVPEGQPMPSPSMRQELPSTDGQPPTTAPTEQGLSQDLQPQPQDLGAAQSSSSRASLSPGADTPQLGRLDQANRLNLFDNMTAAPQNKVWFGYQYSSGINTGMALGPDFATYLNNSASNFSSPGDVETLLGDFGQPGFGILQRQRQNNYRIGAEVMLTCDFSVAVQGQYYENLVDDGPYGSDWSQPQILLKHMLCRDCDSILSATLGIQPETSVDVGDFEDDTTRLYPGMLFYEMLSPNLFSQGGFQFGIPVREDQIHTFDWSLSLGFWLYRAAHGGCGCNDGCANSCQSCCMSECGGPCGGGCGRSSTCCPGGLITGIIPQVGLLGKHVVGDNTRSGAFGFQPDAIFVDPFSSQLVALPEGFFIYNEPTDVLDLTVGTLIVLAHDVQIGVGYSFPLTDKEVRDDEFLTYVNYLF